MKILVADGDPGSRLLISRSIATRSIATCDELLWAETGEQVLAALLGESAPVAIVDSGVPGIDGLEICRRVREKLGPDRPYIILLTDPRLNQDTDQAFAVGADDVIIKPIDAGLIQARLRIASRILELQERCERALDPVSDRDSLTGLWGRPAIIEFMRAQFARSTRDGISMGLILGDMDNFYSANAKYGEAACDIVLREAAKRLSNSLRPYDLIGRFGGEAFLIIAPDCTLSNAQVVADRLRLLVGDEPFEVGGKSIPVTISFGVATTAETGALDAEGLLRSADAALLAAKEHGRDRIEVARRIPRQRTVKPHCLPSVRARELVQ